MLEPWSLPRQASIGGVWYPIHTDFRDILEIFSYFADERLPQSFRWQIALGLFYEGQIPQKDTQEAMDYLLRFVTWGQPDKPGPKRMDWQQDAPLILADINRVAGREVRDMAFVHWWTFLSWFRGIGQGQLSAVVAIRDKLARGKKLESWEQEYYRQNREQVLLRTPLTERDRAQKQRLEEWINGKT